MFGFVGYYLVLKQWHLAVILGLAVVPYALWQVVLWGWLSGFFDNPNQFLLFGLVLVPMTYLPMLLLGIRATRDPVRKHLWHPFVLWS